VAGKSGGGIARKARVELEEKTGRSVVTGESFLPQGRKMMTDD
jgi:DNA-damage-inducible protein D